MILKGFLSKFTNSPVFSTIFCLQLLLLTPVFSAVADEDKQQYQQKLDSIRSNIAKVEGHLDKDKSQRGKLQKELKKIDKKIARLTKEINYTNFLVKKHKKSLKSLKKELKKLEKSLSIQKESLAKQIKAAYIMGNHETAKLLLNQQNAIEMGQAVIYYQYLNRTRSHQILEYNLLVQEKTALKDRIIDKSTQLTKLKKQQLQQKGHFSASRKSRNHLIRQLNSKITNNEDALTSLQSHRRKIEDLLISLGEVLADIPGKPANQKPFPNLKGRLPWPVAGRIKNKFGAKRARSDLKWNGVVLGIDYGTPVKAVSRGRVIFSDWLQGYGFIIILDHGSGYMSLYGYNQNLVKETGDWVNKGDVIATVGDSGGQASSGLYFEIRKHGKPVNPRKWCSIKYNNTSS